ncbi:MAG: polysaccharide biosynthesis tyrosine autokinase [Kiritimatiellae bacterium]|nr:polysaccharide biosynthesis tyrosine autokinase [Kiritimatiellia bacterium]
MADKPIYYASNSKSPMYYGGKSAGPLYYGSSGNSPMYYGAQKQYGAAYGGYMPYGGDFSGQDEGSMMGTLTLGRVLRVVSQRWLSIFVFLLVGLIVAFAVYRISPTIYEATSEFTMDMRRSTGGMRTGNPLAEATPDYGNTYAEIFNTRISDWRSDKLITKVVQQYRATHPASTISDEEILGTLGAAKLELVKNSRIITISLRSKTPALCAALANSYAESIESFTDEENKIRCDKSVSQIHTNVERKRREVDKIAKQLLDFRTANKVDNLRSQRETVQQGLSKTTGDILALETEETQLVEWEKMLSSVQKDPASYGNLSTGVPRAQEIATEFRAYQDAEEKHQKLMFAYTESHPEVIAANKGLELSRQRFLDAAARALLTGRSTLNVARNRLANLRNKQEELRNELASVEQRIVLAESGLGQLEAEFGVANRVLEGLIMDENKARIQAESNNEIVRVGRPAGVPSKPVLPNPTIIFGAGIAVSLLFGVLFVLIIDNLEDTIVNLSDIETRLALKVLGVLPHVRRRKREEVAKHLIEDKYSQFSESVAGIRNLLESPRYEAMSHCILIISTQPGEGKTITSTSIAISYAQAGRKTLLVDFDLRRPRLQRIWGIEIDQSKSFSHVLQSSVSQTPDFSAIVNNSPISNLDIVCSLPPDGISPATIFGSSIVPDFFTWARANYDHIIVDSPPYGVVGDVVSLSTMVDSSIIMCCPDRTHFRPIQYCARSLTEAGANILGVVVNDIEISNASAFTPHSHSRRYGGRYGYGYGYRPVASAENGEDGSSENTTDAAENNNRNETKGFSDDE